MCTWMPMMPDGEFWSSVHCYFVCTKSWADSDLQDPTFREFETIREARRCMMHIDTTTSIAKYICRWVVGLGFSFPLRGGNLKYNLNTEVAVDAVRASLSPPMWNSRGFMNRFVWTKEEEMKSTYPQVFGVSMRCTLNTHILTIGCWNTGCILRCLTRSLSTLICLQSMCRLRMTSTARYWVTRSHDRACCAFVCRILSLILLQRHKRTSLNGWILSLGSV